MNRKYILNYILYWILQLSWGLLQNCMGLLVFLVLTLIDPKRRRFFYHGAVVSCWKFPFSMGCGMFIFYGHEKAKDAKEVLVHEYGHTVQSMVLGPLFSFAVAIPSCVWAFTPVFQKRRKEGRCSYFDLYCESWANKWGEAVLHEPAPDNGNR